MGVRRRFNEKLKRSMGNDYILLGVSCCCMSFFSMQVYRFICIVLMVLQFFLTTYILLRESILYINMWATTFTLFAFVFMFYASGTKVVERKLEKKGIELLDEEKSYIWRFALFIYEIALPFSFTSLVLFEMLVGDNFI